MRRGIGLRGYAQQDPLNEFRREAFQLYEELLRGFIRHNGVATTIFRVTVRRAALPPGTGSERERRTRRGAAALAGGHAPLQLSRRPARADGAGSAISPAAPGDRGRGRGGPEPERAPNPSGTSRSVA